jgi:flagellar biosynthesis protein FlhG
MMSADETNAVTGPTGSLGDGVLVIAGGKGGVGKTQVALNLSAVLSERGMRVLLVDGGPSETGVAPLLGLRSTCSLSDVVAGSRTLEEIALKTPAGFDLLTMDKGSDSLFRRLPGDSRSGMAALRDLFGGYERVIIDAPCEATPAEVSLIRSATDLILVSTPEPMAFTKTYALLKRLHWDSTVPRVRLVMNMVDSEKDAISAAKGFLRVAENYLGSRIEFLGTIPYDAGICRAARAHRLILHCQPWSIVSQRFRDIGFAVAESGSIAAPVQSAGATYPRREDRVRAASGGGS